MGARTHVVVLVELAHCAAVGWTACIVMDLNYRQLFFGVNSFAKTYLSPSQAIASMTLCW